MSSQVVKLPELFALFGQPVAGNPMQEMIEAAFRARGLNWLVLDD
jgi:shikimate 5-dehydrogenase